MSFRNGSSFTYEKVGVPRLKGNPVFERQIATLVRRSRIPGVFGKATGFSSLFDLKVAKVRDPIVVSSTDGVGTKLELARLLGRHNTIGIDLVAMCVNDVLTAGAKPVFFLDYFATGKHRMEVEVEVLKGIVRGCREAGCALVGGETAIMPGFYEESRYDLAGFSVGIVERKKLIDGGKIRAGNKLLGLASSGFHSNGFSLLRKIFSKDELRGSLGRKLLTPTRIYVKPILEILKKVSVAGIAHITGDGFDRNITRLLPNSLGVEIDSRSWPKPKLFETVQDRGNISDFEMFRTFNMGIGMVLILEGKSVVGAQKILRRFNIPNWEIGEVVPRKGVRVR